MIVVWPVHGTRWTTVHKQTPLNKCCFECVEWTVESPATADWLGIATEHNSLALKLDLR